MNIVYASAARLCMEQDGVVVHVEKADQWAEARTPGTGGPRSGKVVGRIEGGRWTVEPASDAVRCLIEQAMSA